MNTPTHDTSGFDHMDPALQPRLHEVLSDLRENRPVAWSEHHGGFWTITRYEDVKKGLRDYQDFTTTGGVMIPSEGARYRLLPVELDPPEHSAYRRMLQEHFHRPQVQGYEPALRTLIGSYVDELGSDETVDVVTGLAEPIPLIAIAMVLGLSEGTWQELRQIATEFRRGSFGEREQMMIAARALEGFLSREIEARRGVDDGTVLAKIVNADFDGAPMPHDALLGMLHVLFIAGYETTVHAIGSLVQMIAVTPGLRERLIAHPETIAAAVDESLRLEAPVTGVARTVTHDLSFGGELLRAGERVLMMIAAANRDDVAFAEPDTAVCPRENNRHLAFGFGVHRCLGEFLARLELTVVADELLKRLPAYELAEGEPEFANGLQVRGLRRLVIRPNRRQSPG